MDNPFDLSAWAGALDEEISQLREEIQRLTAVLSKAEEKLRLVRRLRELEGGLQAEAFENQAEDSTGQFAHPLSRTDSDGTGASSSAPDLEDAVEQILTESGEPMHISLIRDQLTARGVAIPGRGDDANIIVRIRKTEGRFTRTARGTYALASWGLPSVDSSKRRRGNR